MNESIRSPVGVAVSSEDEVTVVCSDGSVWYWSLGRAWVEIDPVPGTLVVIRDAQTEGGG